MNPLFLARHLPYELLAISLSMRLFYTTLSLARDQHWDNPHLPTLRFPSACTPF